MKVNLLEELNTLLRPVLQPDRAAGMRAYMRDQFEFLGIPTTDRRAAAKGLLKQFKGAQPDQLLAAANTLWNLPQREYQYIALDLLAMHHRVLSPQHIPALLQLTQQKSWWDTVDGLANIIGDVLNGEHDYMDESIKHPNMWVRRIAILHQLGWREKTDTRRLFQYALASGQEPDFFIRKAIGWALRDYARCNPDAIRIFLDEHATHLSRLSVREAGKHLR